MAKPKSKLDQAQGASSKVSFDEFVELLNSPKRLTWLNFHAGFMRGVGGVLGAAVILVLLGLAVTYLGGVPLIGELIHRIGDAARHVQAPQS